MIMTSDNTPLFSVRDLAVTFHTRRGDVPAIRGVSFDIAKGETLALVGRSGSGKSVTALSALRLIAPQISYTCQGSARLGTSELLTAPEATLRGLRGNRISYIFQEPMTALDPVMPIGTQTENAIRLHRHVSRKQARAAALELLSEVEISDPDKRYSAMAQELSGGQRQRVLIAMAIANNPDLLIADEPTTALDVTVQAQILALLRRLRERHGMAMLFISHDLDVVAEIADRVAVVEAGAICEIGAVEQVLSHPTHEATRNLLAARPHPLPASTAAAGAPLITVRDLTVTYRRPHLFQRNDNTVSALKGIDFDLHPGRCLALVGESGSGKTTAGLALAGLVSAEGMIKRSDNFSSRDIQTVFQDPYGALSPRMRISDIVAEGLVIQRPRIPKAEIGDRVKRALEDVRLPAELTHRYPSELSGGQRQRVAIARALVLRPRVIVLDEPTSALDLPVQARVLETLRTLQEKYGLSYLFISHDLRAVAALAQDIAVLKDGLIVEAGTASHVMSSPDHPYTQALVKAAIGHVPEPEGLRQ